jgi:hypothetical protein
VFGSALVLEESVRLKLLGKSNREPVLQPAKSSATTAAARTPQTSRPLDQNAVRRIPIRPPKRTHNLEGVKRGTGY